MQKLAITLFAAMMAGCAPQAGDLRDPATYKSLPAPTRDDVATRIDAADEGGAVEVRVGTVIAVELIGVPTAGYAWGAVEVPAFLAPDGEAGGATSEAQLQPGFAGGSHWEVFYFRVSGAGEGDLVFHQARDWESDEPPSKVFTVTVTAAE